MLFIEVNQGEVAVNGCQRWIVASCPLPTGGRFVHLPFIVPEVPEKEARASILGVRDQSRLQGQDAIKAVWETTVGGLLASLLKISLREFGFPSEGRIVTEKIEDHRLAIGRTRFARVSRDSLRI